MRFTHRVAQLLAVYSIISGATIAHAQNFPNRPVRIVTSEPGGGNDFNSRLIAPGLSESIGQPVIVENRGAAPGPAATAARAQPDGYTLLIYSGTLWIMPLIRRDVAFDPVKDFSPVALATSSPNVLVVHPTLPVKSVKELISTVKRRPGEFNYSTGPRGSTPHLAMELFKALAGVDIVSINYKGIGPAIIGLVGGQVQMTFASPGGISQHVKAGKLHALAVTSAQTSSLFPELPTVASDLPGYEIETLVGIWAPKGTSTAIINRLNQGIVRSLSQPNVKERFFNAGIEAVGSSPDALARIMKSDTARLSKVIQDAGIRE